ncbi:MAG: GNAT family N-acetyltransferase [Candidatus Limnocylindrales bacterium]
MSWYIRPYRAGDEAGILRLWAEVFGKPMSIETWTWKMRRRPSRVANEWVAADDSGAVVGHYGGMPLDMTLGDEVVPALSSVDAMTRPDFRGHGLAKQLIQTVHAVWADAGVALAIGLPNETLKPWREQSTTVFELSWLRMPLRLDEIVGRGGREGWAGPIARPLGLAAARLGRRSWPRRADAVAIRDVSGDEFDGERLEQVWSHAAPSFTYSVVRDADWWKWRFVDHPEVSYRLLLATKAGAGMGAIAYKVTKDGGAVRGVLAELLCRDGDRAVANTLVRAALEDLWQRGAGTVHALAPAGGPLEATLRAQGFRSRPEAFTFMYVPLSDVAIGLSRDPALWHLSGADFDVV